MSHKFLPRNFGKSSFAKLFLFSRHLGAETLRLAKVLSGKYNKQEHILHSYIILKTTYNNLCFEKIFLLGQRQELRKILSSIFISFCDANFCHGLCAKNINHLLSQNSNVYRHRGIWIFHLQNLKRIIIIELGAFRELSDWFSISIDSVKSVKLELCLLKKTLFDIFSPFWKLCFSLRKDKDNVLCRQADKNVTFATMNHKHLETGGMMTFTWLLRQNILTYSFLRPHESILACSILYWFWEFRAHRSLDKYFKTKVNNVQFDQNFEKEGFEGVYTNTLKVNNFLCDQNMA